MLTAKAVEAFALAVQVGDRSERGVADKPDPELMRSIEVSGARPKSSIKEVKKRLKLSF